MMKSYCIRVTLKRWKSFTFEKMDYETKMNFKIQSPLKYLITVFDDLEGKLDDKVAQCNKEIKSVEMFEKRLKNKKQDMRDYILKYKTETDSVFSKFKEKVDKFLELLRKHKVHNNHEVCA